MTARPTLPQACNYWHAGFRLWAAYVAARAVPRLAAAWLAEAGLAVAVAIGLTVTTLAAAVVLLVFALVAAGALAGLWLRDQAPRFWRTWLTPSARELPQFAAAPAGPREVTAREMDAHWSGQAAQALASRDEEVVTRHLAVARAVTAILRTGRFEA